MGFLDNAGLQYFWTKLKQKFFPLSGGTVNGDLTTTGKINAGGKVMVYTDGEGGNLRIVAPDQYNRHWEMDAIDGNLRFYTMSNNGGAPIGATLMTNGDLKVDGGGSVSTNYHFTPDFGKQNFISDLMQIDTNGTMSNAWMFAGCFGTEDASTLGNSPITSGPFYGERQVKVVNSGGSNVKVLVELHEMYPVGGRIWSTVYDGNPASWTTPWVCHYPTDRVVIARGASGAWTYTQWSDGWRECSAKFLVPYVNGTFCQAEYTLPLSFGVIVNAIATVNDPLTFDNASATIKAQVSIGTANTTVRVIAANSSGSYAAGHQQAVSVTVSGWA